MFGLGGEPFVVLIRKPEVKKKNSENRDGDKPKNDKGNGESTNNKVEQRIAKFLAANLSKFGSGIWDKFSKVNDKDLQPNDKKKLLELFGSPFREIFSLLGVHLPARQGDRRTVGDDDRQPATNGDRQPAKEDDSRPILRPFAWRIAEAGPLDDFATAVVSYCNDDGHSLFMDPTSFFFGQGVLPLAVAKAWGESPECAGSLHTTNFEIASYFYHRYIENLKVSLSGTEINYKLGSARLDEIKPALDEIKTADSDASSRPDDQEKNKKKDSELLRTVTIRLPPTEMAVVSAEWLGPDGILRVAPEQRLRITNTALMTAKHILILLPDRWGTTYNKGEKLWTDEIQPNANVTVLFNGVPKSPPELKLAATAPPKIAYCVKARVEDIDEKNEKNYKWEWRWHHDHGQAVAAAEAQLALAATDSQSGTGPG